MLRSDSATGDMQDINFRLNRSICVIFLSHNSR